MKYLAFTDGSYKQLPSGKEAYSSAAIVAPESTADWKVLTKAACDKYVVHHNIAGEIFAVLMLFEHLLNNTDCTEVTVVYDQKNIGLWATGVYQARIELSQLFVHYLNTYVKPKIKVNWIWTKSHAGTEGNELADTIARDTLEDFLSKE